MKKCFSCQLGANQTTLTSLEIHKRDYEQTGQVYWFYKADKDSQTQIADDDSFRKIKERIKDNEGAEWSHIAEFGRTSNDNVPENTQNKKSKAFTSKRKPKKS